MTANTLPVGWSCGAAVSYAEIDSEPPQLAGDGRIQFHGLRHGDQGHRLYSIPAHTPVADVVSVFEVGSHGAMSYSFDSAATVALVRDKATQISELVSCRVIFADAAGLVLKFSRPITEDEFKQLEALFSDREMVQAGLGRYLSEWDGEGPVLAPVIEENRFHFWWD